MPYNVVAKQGESLNMTVPTGGSCVWMVPTGGDLQLSPDLAGGGGSYSGSYAPTYACKLQRYGIDSLLQE